MAKPDVRPRARARHQRADPAPARQAGRAARAGSRPFGSRFPVTHWAGELVARLKDAGEDELKSFGQVSLAGRVISFRDHGKTCFAHLRDRTGTIQLYARADGLGDRFGLFRDLDVGDFVGVTGELMRTRTGELTVQVKELEFLAKSLRPLPDEVAWAQGRGDALPPPLRRSGGEPPRARDLRPQEPAHPGACAPSSTPAASSRSRRR